MLPTDQHSKLKPYTTTTNVDEATMTLSVDSRIIYLQKHSRQIDSSMQLQCGWGRLLSRNWSFDRCIEQRACVRAFRR